MQLILRLSYQSINTCNDLFFSLKEEEEFFFLYGKNAYCRGKNGKGERTLDDSRNEKTHTRARSTTAGR